MKKNKPCCSICRHPGFKALAYHEDRPVKVVFQCDKCQNTWSWGRTGGEYIFYCMNKEQAISISQIYLEINKKLKIL